MTPVDSIRQHNESVARAMASCDSLLRGSLQVPDSFQKVVDVGERLSPCSKVVIKVTTQDDPLYDDDDDRVSADEPRKSVTTTSKKDDDLILIRAILLN